MNKESQKGINANVIKMRPIFQINWWQKVNWYNFSLPGLVKVTVSQTSNLFESFQWTQTKKQFLQRWINGRRYVGIFKRLKYIDAQSLWAHHQHPKVKENLKISTNIILPHNFASLFSTTILFLCKEVLQCLYLAVKQHQSRGKYKSTKIS